MSDNGPTATPARLAAALLDALDALAGHFCDLHHGGADCVRCRALALSVAANALGLCPEGAVPAFVELTLGLAARTGCVTRIPPWADCGGGG